MSKRVLITLIVSMAVVMGGLIFVQTNSILKASEIKEEQFDQTVRQALFQVAKKLEIYEFKNSCKKNYMTILPGRMLIRDHSEVLSQEGCKTQHSVYLSLTHKQPEVFKRKYSSSFRIRLRHRD